MRPAGASSDAIVLDKGFDDLTTLPPVDGVPTESISVATTGWSRGKGGGFLYDNGGLATGAVSESGVAAPVGTQWSEVQHDTGNMTSSNTLSGVSCGSHYDILPLCGLILLSRQAKPGRSIKL